MSDGFVPSGTDGGLFQMGGGQGLDWVGADGPEESSAERTLAEVTEELALAREAMRAAVRFRRAAHAAGTSRVAGGRLARARRDLHEAHAELCSAVDAFVAAHPGFGEGV